MGRFNASLAAALASSGAQGCCDPAVTTDMSSQGESSTTTGEGSATESTGEDTTPQWAIGSFSRQSANVGTTMEHSFWYPWGKIEITSTGTMFYERYDCAHLQERQEFRWTTVDGGQRLSLQSVPPSDVFTFGNGTQVSELAIEPGDACDTIIVRYLRVDPMQWVASEYQRGDVCARPTGAEGCAFTFEWCDGEPPAPCE